MAFPASPEPKEDYLNGLHAALETQLEVAQRELGTSQAFARKLRVTQEILHKREEGHLSLTTHIKEGEMLGLVRQPCMRQVGQPLVDTTPPLAALAAPCRELSSAMKSAPSRDLSSQAIKSDRPHPIFQDRTSTTSDFASETSLGKSSSGTDCRSSSDPKLRRENSQMSLALSLASLNHQERRSLDGEGDCNLWPSTLTLRKGLARTGGSRSCDVHWLRCVAVKNSSRQSHSIFPRLSRQGTVESNMTDDPTFNRCVVMDPAGLPRRIIDRLSFLVLFYDLTVTPYMLAWHPQSFAEETSNLTWSWSEQAALCSTIFWFLEAISNFFTGYYDPRLGEVTLGCGSSSKNYMRTWFAFDVTMLSANVLSHIVEDWFIQGALGGVHTLRILKCRAFLKAWSVLRILKLPVILGRFLDQATSDRLKMAAEVGKICCALIWLSHIICCAYFAISQWAPSDTGWQWMQFSLEGLPTLESSGEMYQYFTVFHWSMSQITSGQMEYFPLNTPERQFTIICQLFGLIFGSYLVARVSTIMIELQHSHQEQTNQLHKLCQFMDKHGISRTTFAYASRQAKERLARPSPWTFQELKISPVVKLLSENLRSKVFYETLGPHVSRHSLLRVWSQLDEGSFQRLCLEAVDMRHFCVGDEVIATGETAQAAYMVVSGELMYTRDMAFITLTADPFARTGSGGKGRPTAIPPRGRLQAPIRVGVSEWLAEIALWSNWFHVGRAVAGADSKILLVSPSKFVEIVTKSALIKDLAVEYACNYYQILLSARPPLTRWPDDVSVPSAEYCDIVATMDESARKLIGDIALRHVHNHNDHGLFHHGASKVNRPKLEHDIDHGNVMLVQDGSGEVYRSVHLSVLRALDGDGFVLIKLATFNEADNRLEPKGALPGILQHGELPGKALERLLDRDFKHCQDSFKFSGISREIEWRESMTYGVKSKFTRNVAEVRMSGQGPCLGQEVKFRTSLSAKKVGFAEENDFQGRQVFIIRSNCGRSSGIFSWVSMDEYQFLQEDSKEAKAYLNRWLDGLALNPDETEVDIGEQMSARFSSPMGSVEALVQPYASCGTDYENSLASTTSIHTQQTPPPPAKASRPWNDMKIIMKIPGNVKSFFKRTRSQTSNEGVDETSHLSECRRSIG